MYVIDQDLIKKLREKADSMVRKGNYDDDLVALMRQAADRLVALNAEIEQDHPARAPGTY